MSLAGATHRTLALAFGTVASLVELGPVIALLRTQAPLSSVLTAGLAYQVGGAVARWLPGSRTGWVFAGLLGAAGVAAPPPGSPIWLIALGLLAWALQAARRRHAEAQPKAAPSTALKRMTRVAGFVAAALAPVPVAALLAIGAVAGAALLCGRAPAPPLPRLPRHPMEGVMVLHQMHYFVYCYGLLAVLAAVAGGPGLVGAWFALGWITYLSAERLWRPVPLATALMAGHLFVAATLLGFGLLGQQAWAAVGFWILTGLGGGTVYCLTRLHRETGAPAEALDVAEDLGHVGGAVLALALAVIFGLDGRGLACAGTTLALATILAFMGAARPRPLPAGD